MNTPELSISTFQPRLLLVDDDPSMIRIVGQMLAEFPDQRFATSGEAALSLARAATPDLILLDANLPNMTGFDVCEILKQDARLARVPIIFVTSHDAPALEVDAFRMGASDYVTKPLVAQRLQARVRAQLRPRRRVMETAARLREEGGDTAPSLRPSTRVLAVIAADTAEAHHDALEAIGKLEVVPDCESALRALRRQAPGAIVLEATDTTRAETIAETLRLLCEAHPEVPTIVLTHASDVETERRTLDAGAADVIVKPVKPAVLQARVRAALASAHAAEEDIRALLDPANRARVHPFPGTPR